MIELTNGVQLPESSITFLRKVSMDGLALCDPIRLVQYDDTLPVLAATLWVGGVQYIPPEGAAIRIRWYKPDAHGVYNPALGVGDDGTVYIQITQAMTSAAGTGYGNIEVAVDGGVKCSDPIPATISRNAVQEGSIVSTDEFKTLDQILAEVQALQAQVEQDAQQAEAANQEAQEAAARAEAVDAYPRQKANDRFALALKADTGKGTSHEIYPDEGSNIVVTAYGYTEQEGSGDPSPENVRPIKVGGRKLRKIVFTGDETLLTIDSGVFFKLPALANGYSAGYAYTSEIRCYPPGIPGRVYPFCSITYQKDKISINLFPGNTIEDVKSWLIERYNAGSPFTLWYETADGSSDGIFTPSLASGLGTEGGCLPLNDPLCDGDYVVSSKDGQCVEYHDRVFYTVTGSETVQKVSSAGGVDRFILGTTVKCAANSTGWSNMMLWNNTIKSNCIYVGNNENPSLCFTTGTYESADALKQKLKALHDAGTPMVFVFSRQTPVTYTHAPVSLIAQPDATGKVTVSGEKDVSAVYNKSIAKAIEELNEAIMKLGGTI